MNPFEVEERIFELGEKIGEAFWMITEFINEVWSEVQGNEGQMSILYNYMLPALYEMLESWGDSWPHVDAVEYEETLFGAHPNVEVTWSDTIYESTEQVYETVDRAQAWQWTMEYLESILPW